MSSQLSTLPLLAPITITLLALSILFTIHRVYIRLHLYPHRLTRPDYIHLLTVFLLLPLSTLLILLSTTLHAYLASHSPILLTTQTAALLRWSTVVYALAACTSRIALAALSKKQNPHTHTHNSSNTNTKSRFNLFKPALNSLLALQVATSLVFLGLTLFPCASSLAVSLTSASCNAGRLSRVADVVWSALNIAVGIAVLLMGVVDLVRAAAVRASVKFLASVPITVGAGAVVAAIVRVVIVSVPWGVVGTNGEVERGVLLALLAVVEVGLAVVAGCLGTWGMWVERCFFPGEEKVALEKAEQGLYGTLESRPVTRRGRDLAREGRRQGRTRDVNVSGARETRKGEIMAWSDAVGIGIMGHKVDLAAVRFDDDDDDVSPMGSPHMEQSIWKH